MSAGKLPFAAAILAGGNASRMGGINKACIKYGDEYLFDRVLNPLRPLFGEIILVTHRPDDFKAYPELLLTSDEFPGRGPIAGIHAALKATTREAIFMVSCDMPHLSRDFLRMQAEAFLLSGAEIFIPRHSNNIEPLHAYYKSSILGPLTQYLNTEGKSNSIRAFFPEVTTKFWEVDESRVKSFTNINNWKDLIDEG